MYKDYISVEVMFFLIAFSGFIVGKIFHKIKLPDISGQVILGVLIGPSGAIIFSYFFESDISPLFSLKELHNLDFFSDIALGIMTFTIGSHLQYKTLHNAGNRIITLSLFDTTFCFTLVFSALYTLTSLSLTTCFLLSSIAIATAPGTIISLIQSKRARGVFTKTILGVVALGNFATIFVFELSKSVILQTEKTGGFTLDSIITPLSSIAFTLLSGIVIGFIVVKLTQHEHNKTDLFAIVFFMLMANIVMSQTVLKEYNLSPLLVNLVAGVVYGNLSYHTDDINSMLTTLNGVLFSLFFTLAGTHLDINQVLIAGLAGIIFTIARVIAKYSGAYIAASTFKFTDNIKKYLGLALVPQAGLAIGLTMSLNPIPEFESILSMVTAIVLTSVAINELIGPVITSKTIDWSNETDQAQPRLVDFIQEEFILLPVKAQDKWEAIKELTSFMVKTNDLHSITEEELYDTIEKREKEFSTAIGNSLAVPHGRIAKTEKLMGVIGICGTPIEFDTPDNKPVDIIVLIATPEGKEHLHLKILSAVAKIFTGDTEYHDRLINSKSSAEAFDLLQNKEVRSINSFLSQHNL